MRKDDVLDNEIAREAVLEVFKVFEERELTVAECVCALKWLSASFFGVYPDVFKLLWPSYGEK